MNNPLVSIIIPTFNRAHLIGETLDSVLAQTYENWECIIVDDGSTDNTAEVVGAYIQKDGRFQYHHRPVDRLPGGNAARNYGFELSKGEYVQWFDDDDIMHSNKLFFQMESLLSSSYNFSVCQTLNFKNDIGEFYGLRPDKIKETDPFVSYLKEDLVLFTPSTIWKRSLLILGNYKFNEELKASQEWEFYCNVFFNEKFYDYLEKPLVYIRYHNKRISSSNPSSKFWNYYLARLIVYEKYNKKIGAVELKYLINYFVSVYVILLKRKEYKMSFKIFRVIFNTELFTMERRIYLSLSMITFVVFNKGAYFVKKIKF